MVFNKDYDMSLWLILSGNKKTRKMVADFIRDIPEELYQKIHKSLVMYEVYDSDAKDIFLGDSDLLYLQENVIECEDKLYWYCIDMITGTLQIRKTFVIDGDLMNTIKFILYPIKKVDYENLKNSENISLGILFDTFIAIDSNDISCSYSISFDLVKKLFGRLAVDSFDYSLYRKYVNLVNVDMLPENFDLRDLAVNNFVRRKKKRNSK